MKKKSGFYASDSLNDDLESEIYLERLLEMLLKSIQF